MVKSLLLVIVTMLVTATGTYFVVGGSGPDQIENQPTEEVVESDTVEVPIDSFSVSNSLAAPGSMIHVRFKLVTTVAQGQEKTFGELVSNTKQARVRQAVIKVARSSTLEDLKDPELSVLKRQIKEELNKVLRKSYVNDVVISSFSTMEQ